MKKFLLSIFCLFSLVGFATAEEVTGVAKDVYGSATADIKTPFEAGPVTLTFAKGEGSSTAPAFNKSGDCRAYAKNTVTATCSAGNLTKIVFTISSQGKKRLTDITPSTGTITIASDHNTVTWEGEATEIILTVGDKAVHGTDGSSKAGQFCFTQFTATYSAPTASAVATPTFSVEKGTYYNPFSVEIAAEEGATVYYTLDGTEPTTESAVYSKAIAFDEFGTSTTLKAIAAVDGELSNVASATYSLEVAAPVFSVKGGVYEKLTGETALQFTCETKGATIHYNNRGGDPKTAGSKSYGSLSVLSTAEVKAVAFVEVEGEKIYSNVVSEKYYISPVKPFEKVTEFAAGSYLIHSQGFAATALSETGNYGYLPQFAVEANGNFIETNAFYAFTFTEVEGGYTIQDTFGRYVYQTGTYNSFNVADEMPTEGAVWTVTIDETTGEATITNTTVNKYIQYSSQYKSYGSYADVKGTKPSLYKLGEYPTITVTPENWATVSAFEKVTITCESGIAYNETDENYPYYTIGWDYTPHEFDKAEKVDENTIVLSFNTPIQDNGDYRVTLPAGLFTLNPDGLAMPSKEAQYTYTVDNPNMLEIVYATPDNGDNVESIEYLYFEYSQDIIDQVEGAVITNENGDEYPLTVTYTDAWGEKCPYNALCLKTAEPITAPGVYTFVLKSEYAYTESNVRLAEDITYTFTIKESLKITSISPVAGTDISAIDEFIIEFNQDVTCYAEGFPVYDENGTEYAFMVSLQDKDGNELPSNMVRAYTATPITAAGTYTMFIFDVYPMGSWEGLNETYVFTFNGSSITSGIEEVKGEPTVDASQNGNAKTIYDLTGRRVETITKPGIYIVGGKKVLVK